jgi:hypothetical protein
MHAARSGARVARDDGLGHWLGWGRLGRAGERACRVAAGREAGLGRGAGLGRSGLTRKRGGRRRTLGADR